MKALIVMSAILAGQCGPSACPTVQSAEPVVSYILKQYWVRHEGRTILVEGYVNAVGNIIWNKDREFNRKALKPHVHPVNAIPNYGIATEKMGRHALGTQSPEAVRFIKEAAEASSEHKLHLTVIGSDLDRDRVMSDLATGPAFASLRDHLMVQGYRPDEWAVDPSHGFQGQGKPSIIAELPRSKRDPKGGRVVYRALDYSMGPDVLARALTEEVRKLDPSYNPAFDPGPAAGGGLPFGLTQDELLGGGLLIGFIALLHLVPRKVG